MSTFLAVRVAALLAALVVAAHAGWTLRRVHEARRS